MTVRDLILVSLGNSRTRLAHAKLTGTAKAGELAPATVIDSDQTQQLVDQIVKLADTLEADAARIVIASVNEPACAALLAKLSGLPGLPALVRLTQTGSAGASAANVLGLKIPIATELDPGATPGVDRLLCALAAHDRSHTACVVIDAGTAVTVDLVGKFGAFQGGVIAPGLRAMLQAMSGAASALPMLEVPRTEADAVPAGPLGRNTRDAMLLGAIEAVRGLSHRMIDRYAEVEGGYPRVIATGGDAALLFREDDLIEHIVPDLVLIGMQTAWIRSEFPGAFEGQEAGGFEDDELDDGDDFGDPMTDERP